MHRKQKREPSGSLKTVDHVAVEGFGQVSTIYSNNTLIVGFAQVYLPLS